MGKRKERLAEKKGLGWKLWVYRFENVEIRRGTCAWECHLIGHFNMKLRCSVAWSWRHRAKSACAGSEPGWVLAWDQIDITPPHLKPGPNRTRWWEKRRFTCRTLFRRVGLPPSCPLSAWRGDGRWVTLPKLHSSSRSWKWIATWLLWRL
jgi:hypothetical protein